MPAVHRRAPLMLALFAALAAIVELGGATFGTAAASGPSVVVITLDPHGPAPGAWSCLAGNPACARHDPWWREALLQPPAGTGSVVEFSPLGAGFTADPRLTEGVLWLWSWPDGRTLLRAAAARGVSLRVATLPAAAGGQVSAARYDVRTRAVDVDARFVFAPSWLLGDVLAHELTHAAQDAAGQQLGPGQAACVAAELPARRTEAAYLSDLFDRLGAPPANAAAALSPASAALLQMAEGLLGSADLPGLVAGLCAAGAG